MDDEVRATIKRVVDGCGVCRKFARSLGKPKVAIPKVTDFNQIVAIDLKQFGEKNVLWMICVFTRYMQGIVLSDKEAQTVVNAMNEGWNLRVWFPSGGFWSDNGTEFKNKEMNEFASKFGFSVKFGPTYSLWSNRLNERNHYSADIVVKKIMETDRKINLQTAVNMAAWTHNTNVNVLGFEPMRLVTGKSVMFPGISVGNVATESLFDNEAIAKIMECHHEVTKKFREIEYGTKLERASEVQNRKFNSMKYKEGDLVFYQEKMQKSWSGPVKVFCHRGRDVFLWANGDLKKVADCKVQPYKTNEKSDDEEVVTENDKEDGLKVVREDKDKENVTGVIEDEEKVDEVRKMRSMTSKKKKGEDNEYESRLDCVGAFWMTSEKKECFDEVNTTFVVELPVKYHKMPEVIEAKEK